MIRQIPNIITALNLMCGCVAILFAVSGDLTLAAFFALTGIFFDYFDGLAARLLHAQSEVGLQLDSLADVVTSGVVPALVMVQLLSLSLTGNYIQIADYLAMSGENAQYANYLPLMGLLIAVASAYRLAKFNVDTRQTTSFIGLPTPANTLLILSLPLMLTHQHSELVDQLILNKWVLIGLTLLSCFLLNAEIRLFGLKFKTWDLKQNGIRYAFLAISVLLIVLLKFIAIPLLILLYIVLSLVWKEKA